LPHALARGRVPEAAQGDGPDGVLAEHGAPAPDRRLQSPGSGERVPGSHRSGCGYGGGRYGMSAEGLTAELLRDGEARMQKTVEATHRDLSTIRTGRANPAILDRVEVDYYGSKLPLAQVATISAPEPRMLVIAPWDRNALGPIERGLMKS